MIIHNYEYVVTCNKNIMINNKGITDVKTATSLNTSLIILHTVLPRLIDKIPQLRRHYIIIIIIIIIIIKTILQHENVKFATRRKASKWGTP